MIIARPFAIGAFAVTRGEFAAFARDTGHKPDQGCYFWTGTTWEERADRSWQSPGFAQDDRHPVLCVALADRESRLRLSAMACADMGAASDRDAPQLLEAAARLCLEAA